MKKAFVCLLAGLLALALAVTAFAEAASAPAADEGGVAGTWHVQTGNRKPLNVRKQPSTKSQLITKLDNNTNVEVIEATEDGEWAHIRFGSHLGYCKFQFLVQGKAATQTKTTARASAKSSGTSTKKSSGSSSSKVKYVQCPDCGQWFEEGNIYRNHICPAKTSLVQCPYCGLWYAAGDDYNNHYCPFFANPESTLVQCPDCGQWFEEGAEFRNHYCPAKQQQTQGHTCTLCGQWFPDEASWRDHICPALPTQTQCPDCGQWFSSWTEYQNHVCPAQQVW